jgi:urease accessory protein
MTAFVGGFAQFFIPTHLLVVVAIGLMAGQGAKRFPWLPLAAYSFGLAVGSLMIAAALREQNAALLLLAVAAIAGAIVVAALPVPPLVPRIIAAATGGALAFNAPPHEITIAAAIVSQIGSATAALVTLAAAMLIARYATQPWQRIAVRIVGSWMAASAILVLALRLAR